MKTFVVVPCLNEQEHLAATCASLGFGSGAPSTSRLVLVDNASTDATPEVMARIRGAAEPRQVTIVHESTRGYVPARQAGVAAVLKLSQQESVPPEEVLLLQGDADTIYLPGYIDAMIAASAGLSDCLLEGSAVTGREFRAEFLEFDDLCRGVDFAMERWLASDNAQIVVDDKVCGFVLSDYLKWGGHCREVDKSGKEVHAETTRLLMRAKRNPAVRRFKVESACAVPSRRKLWSQGPAYFASAGFPRDNEWVNSWVRGPQESYKFLAAPGSWNLTTKAIRSRQRHLLGLFALLPAMYQADAVALPHLAGLASQLHSVTGTVPGHMLGTVLALADEDNGVLQRLLDEH